MLMKTGCSMLDFIGQFAKWKIYLAVIGVAAAFTTSVYFFGYFNGKADCKLDQLKGQLNAEKTKSKALRDADDCLLSGGVWLQDSGKCSMSIR